MATASADPAKLEQAAVAVPAEVKDALEQAARGGLANPIARFASGLQHPLRLAISAESLVGALATARSTGDELDSRLVRIATEFRRAGGDRAGVPWGWQGPVAPGAGDGPPGTMSMDDAALRTGIDPGRLARDPAALARAVVRLRGDPAAWSGLSAGDREALITARPEQIGRIDGLPTLARDRANRIVLARARAALEARRNQLGLQLARPVSEPGPGGYPQVRPGALSAIEENQDIGRKLAGIAVIEQRLRSAPGRRPAYLLGFDANSEGHAIVAVGNPDTAANNVTYVPGTGTRLGKVRGLIEKADIMAADGGPDTSAIMWLGYDAPPGLASAASQSYAEAGAGALRSFQAGLRISHVGPHPARTTVLGHSYGTTLVGQAASRGGGLDAENLVFVASPGVDVDHVSQLQVGHRHEVYATVAANDPVLASPDAQVFGFGHGIKPADPTPDYGARFGVRPFVSDPGSPEGAHSEYWEQGNEARANIARIVTGRGKVSYAPEVVPPPPPPFGMFPW